MLASLPIGWRIHLTTLVAVIGLLVVGTLGALIPRANSRWHGAT